jgi:hypothetical protein
LEKVVRIKRQLKSQRLTHKLLVIVKKPHHTAQKTATNKARKAHTKPPNNP